LADKQRFLEHGFALLHYPGIPDMATRAVVCAIQQDFPSVHLHSANDLNAAGFINMPGSFATLGSGGGRRRVPLLERMVFKCYSLIVGLTPMRLNTLLKSRENDDVTFALSASERTRILNVRNKVNSQGKVDIFVMYGNTDMRMKALAFWLALGKACESQKWPTKTIMEIVIEDITKDKGI
jgi:hypothetical protein